MSRKKEVVDFVKMMKKDGWELVRGHKHFILRKRQYDKILKKMITATIAVSKTPSDRRSLRNSYRDACVRWKQGTQLAMQAM